MYRMINHVCESKIPLFSFIIQLFNNLFLEFLNNILQDDIFD